MYNKTVFNTVVIFSSGSETTALELEEWATAAIKATPKKPARKDEIKVRIFLIRIAMKTTMGYN